MAEDVVGGDWLAVEKGLRRQVFEVGGWNVAEVDGMVKLVGTLVEQRKMTPAVFVSCLSFPAQAAMTLDKPRGQGLDMSAPEGLIRLAKELEYKKVIPAEAYYEQMKTDLVEKFGFEKVAGIDKKERIFSTRNYYTQKKFNQFWEESEGYAKMVVLLCEAATSQEAIPGLQSIVDHLLGEFSLDPNRVSDLILDALDLTLGTAPDPSVQDPPKDVLELLRPFSPQYVCEFYKHKLHRYGASSPRLLVIGAHLIRQEFLSLDDIWNALTPKDTKDLFQAEQDFDEKVQLACKSLGMKDLAAKPRPGSAEAGLVDPDGPFAGSQKIAIMGHLLKAGCVKQFLEAVAFINSSGTREGHGLDVAADPLVAQALVSFILTSLEPLSGVKECLPENAESILGYSETDQSDLCRCLLILGPHCRISPPLISRLCKLLANTKNVGTMRMFLDHCLLPGLATSEDGFGLAHQVWDVTRQLAYPDRYDLYYALRHDKPLLYSSIRLSNAKSRVATRNVLRRLTKESTMMCGRQLAKLAHSNSIPLFETMLEQVKGYDNLIGPLVDTAKFLNPLALDELIFMCIEQMASPGRDRLKRDGTNVASWFANLCQFTAMLLRRFAGDVDIHGVLAFAFKRIREGDALVITLVHEIFGRMAGINNSENLSESMVEALAGGRVLRRVLFRLTAAGSMEESSKTEDDLATRQAAEVLRDGLMDNKLVAALPVSVVQQRDRVIYDEDYREDFTLQMRTGIFDKCQEVLVQYSKFLDKQTDEEDEESQKSQRSIMSQMLSVKDLCCEANVSVAIAFLLNRPRMKTLAPNRCDFLSVAGSSTGLILPDMAATVAKKRIEPISPNLYCTFWSLSLGDVSVPTDLYLSELQRLKESEVEATELRSELDRHVARKKEVLDLVRYQNEKLIIPGAGSSGPFASRMLEVCILPRVIISQEDAIFSAMFPFVLLELDVINLNFVEYVKAVCNVTRGFIFSCTEAEALRFGRFMLTTFASLEEWRMSEQVYKEKAHSKRDMTGLHFSGYLNVLWEMHESVTADCCTNLESEEPLEVRNTLSLLSAMVSVFPKSETHAVALFEKVKPMTEGRREDLKLLAVSYTSLLRTSATKRVSCKETFMGLPEPPGPKRITVQQQAVKKGPPPTSTLKAPNTSAQKPQNAQHTRAADHSVPEPITHGAREPVALSAREPVALSAREPAVHIARDLSARITDSAVIVTARPGEAEAEALQTKLQETQEQQVQKRKELDRKRQPEPSRPQNTGKGANVSSSRPGSQPGKRPAPEELSKIEPGGRGQRKRELTMTPQAEVDGGSPKKPRVEKGGNFDRRAVEERRGRFGVQGGPSLDRNEYRLPSRGPPRENFNGRVEARENLDRRRERDRDNRNSNNRRVDDSRTDDRSDLRREPSRSDPRSDRGDPRGDPRNDRGDPRNDRTDVREVRNDPRDQRTDTWDQRVGDRESRGGSGRDQRIDHRDQRSDGREPRSDGRDQRNEARDLARDSTHPHLPRRPGQGVPPPALRDYNNNNNSYPGRNRR